MLDRELNQTAEAFRGEAAREMSECKAVVATRTAIDWPWSSVAAHVEGRHDPLLTREPLVQRLGPAMRTFFDIDVAAEAQRKLRLASSTGRPLGAAAWIKALEATTGRSLAARPVGRPAAHPVLARSSRMETLDPNPLIPAWRPPETLDPSHDAPGEIERTVRGAALQWPERPPVHDAATVRVFDITSLSVCPGRKAHPNGSRPLHVHVALRSVAGDSLFSDLKARTRQFLSAGDTGDIHLSIVSRSECWTVPV